MNDPVLEARRLRDENRGEIYEVARLIAGKSVPANWLVHFLEQWLLCLILDRVAEDLRPSRKEVVDNMHKFIGAAQFLQDSLDDGRIGRFFDWHPYSLRMLEDLAAQARVILKDPRIVDVNGKTKRGRGKAILTKGASSKAEFAAIVAEVWVNQREKEVGARNKQACEAVQLLWEAAGGNGETWGETTRSGWRDYFEEAKGDQLKDFRVQIRYQLKNREAFAHWLEHEHRTPV